jgi:hypothetical protein
MIKRLLLLAAGLAVLGSAATTLRFYFAHAPEADKHGVIAPWYKAQNGQLDFRVRIAAETLKRYPWASADKAVAAAPEYVYNGTWRIDHEGGITAPPLRNWDNADLGQRAAYIVSSLMDYYRYTGDPAGLTAIHALAEYTIDNCQTDATHGWPGMFISVPTLGKPYGKCVLGPSDDLTKGQGKIQLDIVAEYGLELVRAYQMTGNTKWYEATKRWADMMARNRNRTPGAAPWGRYANNASGSGMNDIQTGGVVFILAFFDELIRTGYTGPGNSIVEARDAGRRYLRDVLLPAWTVDDVWGRNYWDWEDPVQAENVTDYVVNYLLDNQDYFPNWRNDARNILSIFLNHTSVSPGSRGDVFHGAWAYPESSGCCDRSLWYGPMELAPVFARYGVEAGSEWGREIGRRSQMLVTYDQLPDGQTFDLIDGGAYVNRSWFKIAHPMALKHVVRTIGWLPEVLGPNRENHIMRSTAVVKRVNYGKGVVRYSTFDAPANTVDVLRLAYMPASITANGKALPADKYTVRTLSNGDCIVTIRHDGATEIEVRGPDPQSEVEIPRLAPGAPATVRFQGNQVRLIGSVDASGGLADIYVDDVKQLAPVDFYSPLRLERQVLYYRNGLVNGPHTLKVVARGARNPLSKGDGIYAYAVQSSDATGDSGFGEGGGPTDAQRMIFGYTGRTDYIDSKGNAWRPGTEFIARTGHLTDVVAKTWWTMRQAVFVNGTPDPELYRYGVHWKDLGVNLTVGPGAYHVRLKFAETECDGPKQRGITIFVNGAKIVDGFDVFATAGGAKKAVDLVFNDIKPLRGVIEIRFVGVNRDAMVQAIEVGPGPGGEGAAPKTIY